MIVILSEINDCMYCKKCWFLQYVECNRIENEYIISGRIEHEDVHTSNVKYNSDGFVITDLQVFSREYELLGRCDTVVFKYDDCGVITRWSDKPVSMYPVEQKHGKTVRNGDVCQLIGQMLCLQEMFGCDVKFGDIELVGSDKSERQYMDDKNMEMFFDTLNYIKTFNIDDIPMSHYSSKCRGCAMFTICEPENTDLIEYMKFVKEVPHV